MARQSRAGLFFTEIASFAAPPATTVPEEAPKSPRSGSLTVYID
jgi:hypothetical protein